MLILTIPVIHIAYYCRSMKNGCRTVLSRTKPYVERSYEKIYDFAVNILVYMLYFIVELHL